MLEGLFSVQGKTAMITGASYGLGALMAQAFAEAGANVVATARSKDKLDKLTGAIRQSGGSAVALACDVADPAQVRETVAEAWQHFGRVDIVINNAGIVAERGIVPEKVPNELFSQTIQVNLNGVWYCCREVGARMLADGKGGSIINNASIMGLGGQSDLAPSYQASKAAVINLTRSLACSWGDRGVRVNAIAPGWFPSELTAGLFQMPDFVAWATGLAAMRRFGDPKELLGPLLFLASDASSYVTGQVLVVDGGYSAGLGAPTLPQTFHDTMEQRVPDGLAVRIRAARPGE